MSASSKARDAMTASPAEVFSRLSNGVYVIGVAHGSQANAFTAAWLTQVSFAPLLVALSVHPDHASYPLLTASGLFGVSVLGRGQLELARRFGTRSGRELDKLAGVAWRRGSLGAPLLLEAAAWLECRVVETMPSGDHELVVARAVGGAVREASLAPMAYADTGNLDGSDALYPPAFPT
jgi:flavin reductase (DIM6/NTAB) family NADH-FMN oxidoreductase RutF